MIVLIRAKRGQLCKGRLNKNLKKKLSKQQLHYLNDKFTKAFSYCMKMSKLKLMFKICIPFQWRPLLLVKIKLNCAVPLQLYAKVDVIFT
jgi:hypothetical protein